MAVPSLEGPNPSPSPSPSAYEPLAPFYDSFTAESKYEPVLDAIESWARAQGLHGRRLLDVACGTGKSFEPLLARGYEVSACDLSPAMVAEARRNWAGVAEIVVADMRDLPWRSEFDLVTCVDDAVNYMLEEEDLRAASLAAGFGHVVFRGLAEGPWLVGEPDEERHLKMVCLAARPG